MQFKQVVGQEEIKAQLLKTVRENRVSHAQLFTGPEGSGKLSMALAFAQYLNCVNRSETDSCGVCSSCVQSQKWIHPDIHYTYPTISLKSGNKPKSTDFIEQWRSILAKGTYFTAYDWLQHLEAGNKQGNITADECTEIIKSLNLKSFNSPFKVQIIWKAGYLKKEGNRLLKLIEEPPANTIILMIEESTDALLTTITSRTQQTHFKRLGDEAVLAGLQMAYPEATHLPFITRLVEGNMAAAYKMAANPSIRANEELTNWIKMSFSNQVVPMNTWIEEMAKRGREQQKNFLQYFLFFLEECLKVKYNPYHQSRLVDKEEKAAKWLGDKMNINQIQSLYEQFNDAIYHIERNANPKMLLLHLSIEFNRGIQKQ